MTSPDRRRHDVERVAELVGSSLSILRYAGVGSEPGSAAVAQAVVAVVGAAGA